MVSKHSVLAIVALIAALLPLPGAAASQDGPMPLPDPVVVAHQITGPATERLNLVILGDGYQWDQQEIFFDDVDRNLAVLWATEPYKSYRNYINVYLVSIASVDYGVRCDPDGRVRHADGSIRDTGEHEGPINEKNTALRMIFSNGCNDPLARGVVYTGAPPNCSEQAAYYSDPGDACESGSQARSRIMDDFVAPVMGIGAGSQNVQTLAIFNTFTYGGIGGTQATTSGGSPQGPLISLHELGHSHGTMADEYPYSSRDVVRNCYTGAEPTSFHHTTLNSSDEMVTAQHKWWRWVGEESLSGGPIDLAEGGNYYPCGLRRPSQHSMMRWIGFPFDQIGREHMVARITGLRNGAAMPLPSRDAVDTAGVVAAVLAADPLSAMVGTDEVLWVKPLQPRTHALEVTWRLGGAAGTVLDTGNAPFLDLADHDVSLGDVVHVEVRDPVGPDDRDWVRNPSSGSSATDSGYNGPRFVQTREWVVGASTVPPSAAVADLITGGTLTDQPVGGSDWVYIETAQPADRVLDVTWAIDGVDVDNPHNLRNIGLGDLGLAAGTFELTATVTDPADPAVAAERAWVVDNVLPTAPRSLSEPLATVDGDPQHGIYFGGWDMFLQPDDDRTGYVQERFVYGEFRLNGDGWFHYFGFPEEEDAPFKFRHSGTNVKALTYGNLGTGGLSKATFEQYFDGHPSGTFEPGYGTHTVEHRAQDPAGNIGPAESYRATALPGGSPECTSTISGPHVSSVDVDHGVTCLAGDAVIAGDVTVGIGAALVAADGARIDGTLQAIDSADVHLFGTTVTGPVTIERGVDVILAGSTFGDDVHLIDNVAPLHYILSGATRMYGTLLVGNTFAGDLDCANEAPVSNMGAPNTVAGTALNECQDV